MTATFATSFTADSNSIIVGNSTSGTGVNVATGGTLSMADTKIDTLNLYSLSALTLTVGASALNFDFKGNTTDLIVLNKNFTVNGAATINVSGSVAGVGGTQYPLLQYAAKDGSGSLVLGTTPPVPFGMAPYTLVYDSTHAYLQANGATPPNDAQWKGNLTGAKGSVWNEHDDGGPVGDTNWVDLSGTPITGVLPGTNTNVYISAASAANFTQTLGGNMSIKSLTFNSNPGANVTIGGTGQQLSISNGITIASGSGANTISASGGLKVSGVVGQSWTNNSTNIFTVSSPISGDVGITLQGDGTPGKGAFMFSGDNSSLTGYLSILSVASLKLGNANALGTVPLYVYGTLDLNGQTVTTAGAISGSGTITNSSVTATATLGFNESGTDEFSGSINDGPMKSVAITKNGIGTTTLSGANGYTGGTEIQGGVLNVASATALGPSGSIKFSGGTLQYTTGLESRRIIPPVSREAPVQLASITAIQPPPSSMPVISTPQIPAV